MNNPSENAFFFVMRKHVGPNEASVAFLEQCTYMHSKTASELV